MTKLTQQEIEQEVIEFKKYLITPIPVGIEDYRNNDFIQKVFNQNVDFINSALTAWLARAELAKGEK